MNLTNQQLTNIPPLILIACIVATFIGIMVYKYREQVKELTIVVILLSFWEDIKEKFW